MNTEVNTMTVNGVEYVRADSVQNDAPSEKLDGMPYVIIRTYSAGVFAGYLKSRNGKEVVLVQARRLWYWKGAASLSQLAMEGVKHPSGCKFPCPVDEIILTEAIEVISTTKAAQTALWEFRYGRNNHRA